MKKLIMSTIIFVTWVVAIIAGLIINRGIPINNAEYEKGYDTGALCGSKFGYEVCIELLKRK